MWLASLVEAVVHGRLLNEGRMRRRSYSTTYYFVTQPMCQCSRNKCLEEMTKLKNINTAAGVSSTKFDSQLDRLGLAYRPRELPVGPCS